MPTDRFLDATTLWPALARLAETAKRPKLVAAPYLTDGGATSLHLGEGDVLLVALTIENCKSGSVSPEEIRKLRNRRVRVYIVRNLHAKVYLFGKSAVVCSANLSTRSKTLDEAGLLTKDPRVIQSIREWFDERQGEPVTPEFLAVCASAFRPPRFAKEESGPRGRSSRLWILGTKDSEPRKDEAATFARGNARAKDQIADRRRFEIDWIRWTGTDSFIEARAIGDLVIVVHNDREVYPHARLVHVERVRGASSPACYVYLESLKDAPPRPWKPFRTKLQALGFPRLGQTISVREVKDSEIRSKVISLMSPDRWTK